jgi:branched-chain amino acid transport system substrate-binding protein
MHRFSGLATRLALLLLATAGVALSGGAWAQPAAVGAAPLRIGISLGLTGRYENITRLQRHAFQLWARDVNRRGGVLGRTVEIVIRDDQSDPAVAKRIYQDFITRDKVDFVFGPYSSDITAAVAPIAEEHGYPMLSAGAASDELWNRGYRHLFGIIPAAGRYTVGFLALLAEARIARVAVVHVDDVYGASLAEGTQKWAKEYGLRVTSTQKIAKDAVELDAVAQAARQSGAEALVLAGHFDESVNMRRALARIGWTPAAYYAAVGPGLTAYYEALGAEANGTFSASHWEAREDLPLPGSAEFLKEFVRAYGERPSYQAALAYAAGQVLERAIQAAGRFDRAAVRDALAELDTTVLVGRYVVDRRGLPAKRVPMVIQWQRGKREIVWPQDLRTAKPILPR